MTFIPLTYKNFVSNKVNNTIEVKYKESDISTHIINKSIDSKSLINLNNYDSLSNEECMFDNDTTNLKSKKNEIKNFYSSINDEITPVNYFSIKDNINNLEIFNDNIKDYNFKSLYKIERIEQKFLPTSFELQKKNVVKNNLYENYRKNYSLDFYKNMKIGFCNYNSINFFSQRYKSGLNHSNCIIYPNTKKTVGNTYDFLNNSFSISAYVNLRKNYSSSNQPECLFHVPNVISIYVVKSIGTNNLNHRISVVIGSNSNKKLVNISSINLNSSSQQINKEEGTFLSSDLDLQNNKWYNICFNVNKNVPNSRTIEILIDGKNNFLSNNKKSFILDYDYNQHINSYICIGNKPSYYKEQISSFINDIEKVFYQFFGSKFNNEKTKYGAFINKDINLGKNNEWLESAQYEIESIINNNEGVVFDADVSEYSESFHGEIHDIRIYKQGLSIKEVDYISKNSINDLSKEIENLNLIFYVPVYYIPVYADKRSQVNGCGDNLNLYFSHIYNPYFANFCGGLEITSESYLLDFVQHTKPNIVIGGKEYENTYDDLTNISVSSLLDSEDDLYDIKKGRLTKSIYNKNLKNVVSNSDHVFFSQNINNNLSYRNLLILPNDNGIPKVKFDIINELINNLEKTSNQYDIDDISHINTVNLYQLSDYENKINYNRLLDDNSLIFPINIEDDNLYNFKFTNDKCFNVSNIIFHDNRIQNMSNIESNIDNKLLNYKVDDIKNSIYPFTESNPILRNYKQDSFNFNTNNTITILQKEIYDNTILRYLKLPIPYADLNLNYDCLFTTIFDVTSKMYNKKIKKDSFIIEDKNLSTSNYNLALSIKDDSYGSLYRSDCLTKVARWNYVGNIFYNEGIISLNRPELCYFGEEDYESIFKASFSMFVQEINIPLESGMFNKTSNETYNNNLRHDDSSFNSESEFVYVTDINLHDENLNIIARAKLARPAPKKNKDNILFRLKMDY